MDIYKAQETIETLQHRIDIAREYRKSREMASEAKFNLEMVLVANLEKIRASKANVGIEMAILMLLEPDFLPPMMTTEVRQYYKEWKANEAKYKGLEKILEAVESKVTFIQSVMKFQRSGEING